MNNTFRLFVSSTFSDFIKERAILNNEIFEKISAFLKRKGCGFQIVDLRWGINTESALNHNTLEICLDEVNYCMNNSPKPNFLIMAGERYGWIPLPSAVEAGEFERILALCDAGEKEMLFKWYLLDENNIPKVYRLSRRSGEYADDGVWYKEEEKLHEILEKKAKECGFDAETMIKYTSSATEHEILKGLFGNEDIADNVIVLMREGYTERDKDLTKTRELKNRIREKMEKDNLSDNIITLDYNEDYYKAMEERVTELLIKNILSEFERLEAEKEDYIPEKLPEGMFCGRKEDIESLNNYLNGDDRGIYFLTGDSGSGKSTLLKEFIHLCLEYNPEKEYEAELEEAKAKESFKELWAAAKRYMNKKPVDIFCVFFGEDDVYNFYDCLKKLCLMMVKKYDITLGEEINRYNISKMFSEILGNTPSGRIVTIVIDGIDMFYDIGEIKENVFPDRLLKDVKIIVSSADEKIVEKFIKEEDKKYRIESFSKEDAIDSFYKMMASKGRTLAPEKQKKLAEEALSNGANPLSCKLLSDLAAGWRSGDIIETFAFDDYEMAKMHIFDMFESCGHDENIVRYVLSYIAVAPFGITEDDLLTLLFMHKEIKESFDKEDRYNYKLEKMPFAILSRLLYELKECISHSMSKDAIIISFNHNVFRKVVLNEFAENCINAENNLLRYYMAMDNYISEDGYPNTKKLMPLLMLLKKNGLYDEIERLLSDIKFADAMIKADKLTELCDFYAYLEEKGILGDYGKKLFSCIKNNSSTLDCYKNGLPGCAESNGIIKAGSILSDFPSGTKSMNFDAKEKIYLSHDGKRYAVIRDEYVYVYREDAYRYYLSIHMELEDYVMQERIINIIWTKDDKLVLVMEDEYLYVYDIREDVPKLEIRIDHISETENVKYVYDYNYLLVMRKNRLTAIDMTEYEIAYELKGPGTAFFDINENEDELLWLMKNSQARRYNLKSGEAIKAETLHYQFTGDADSVYLFDNGIGVGIYNSYNKEVRFLCGETKKYIYFPKSDEIQGFIKYKNALIALYENMIIKASMKDFSLAYVNVPGLCGAYYAGNGEALLAVTEKETKKIREQEFLPFSEKLYLSGKTVDASREMMIGFMLHTMKTYFACDTKRDSFRTLFRRDNSAFRYDASKNSNLYKEYLEKITFMSFYKDSYVMVANEGKGNIRIYDAEGKEIFCLKKLKFSVSNVILESEFSEDGKFLYILETDGIIVIDVKKRKVLSKFGFDKNPPEKVEFTKDGKIAFIKGCRYEFDINKKLEASYKKISERRYTKEEFEGCLYPCLSGAYIAENLLRYTYSDFDYAGNFKAIYRSKGDTLIFENGVFTLNGKTVENEYCDFVAVLRYEFDKSNSKFASLIKIKNDITSKLIRKGNVLLLVSYMLNSVIVFDTEKMNIQEARKWDGEISGIKELPCGFEIYSEGYPYKSTVKFNIEK